MQANMLVDSAGGLMISDLGAAQTGIFKGHRTDDMKPKAMTYRYLPPEMFKGKPVGLLTCQL